LELEGDWKVGVPLWSSAGSWERGIGSPQSTFQPTLTNDVAFQQPQKSNLFRDTMMRLLQSDNLEYKELTKAA
jgi:hypothetical protein